MGCLCGLDDQAVQDLTYIIDYYCDQTVFRISDDIDELKRRLEILKGRLLEVEVNDGN